MLLGWMAWRKPAPRAGGGAALALVLIALVLYPLLAPLDGRSWWQAEVFGLAPDPTVAATLGALLFWRAPWPLWPIPLLWCAASGVTLMELGASGAWLLPALALANVALALGSGRQQVAATK